MNVFFTFSLGVSVPKNRQKYKKFGNADIGKILDSKLF